jgi:hypothetical protein
MISPGLYAYVGTTQIGKTYKAIEMLREYHEQSKLGALVLDLGGAKNFRSWPHAKTHEEVIQRVWVERGLVAYTPSDEEDYEVMLDAIRKAGGIAVLIDEIGLYPRSRQLAQLCRVWAHAGVTLFFTAQHVSADLGQVLLACNPHLFVFKTTSPRSKQWIQDELELDIAAVNAQPLGVYTEIRL